jgi:DNA repair protein RadC
MSYRVPAYRVQLVREGSAMGIRRRCETAREAVEVFRSYVGDADREHFVAIYLDNQDRFLGLNVVAIGTINLLHVAAREVFKPPSSATPCGSSCCTPIPPASPRRAPTT